MVSKNRIEKALSEILKKELGITKRAVDLKINNLKKKRGHDITRRDAALLLASTNGIDISKFASSEKLKEIRELKDKDYKIETKKQIITKKIGKESPYDFSLTKFNLNKNLTQDCSPLFKKPYRGAIKEALLSLEEHIRDKIGSDKDGRHLIGESRGKGVFKRKKNSEEEGLYFLYAGAISWLRNPPSHRKLKYKKEEAIKIILFTDYLIKLFDQLCLENNI